MASLFSKVTKFARSPKGQRMIQQGTEKAQSLSKDPKTRAKIEQARRRFGRGGQSGTGQSGTGPSTTGPSTTGQ